MADRAPGGTPPPSSPARQAPGTGASGTGSNKSSSGAGGVKKAKARVEKASKYEPSMTVALVAYWVLPVLVFAIASRFVVYTGPAVQPHSQSKPVRLDMDKMKSGSGGDSIGSAPAQKLSAAPTIMPDRKKSGRVPTLLANKPTSYIDAVEKISRRRLDWTTTSDDPMEEYMSGQRIGRATSSPSPSSPSGPSHTAESSSSPSQTTKSTDVPRGASQDPQRLKHLETISRLREEFQANPSDMYKAVHLADALRLYDVQYHDGGTAQQEAINTYQHAISLAVSKRNGMLERGEPTNISLSGESDVNEEIMTDYTARSIDGLLCALYSALGKTYFMANMFEKAVESYTLALDIAPTYLDAMSSRGSSRIILGQYPEAAQDFATVMEMDSKRRFQDVFTGLARVLQAKEDAYPGGWEKITSHLDELIPQLENQVQIIDHDEARNMLHHTLNRFYHVAFLYHDVKTGEVDRAWDMLTKSYHHKMAALPPWNSGYENQKISSTKAIFHKGFWPDGVGSDTNVPIFIIGFVRSGSTLLERVLDAHPQIVGTGENSVFNGQLDEIRNKIVQTSMLGDSAKLAQVIRELGDGVVEEMRERWKMVSSGEERAAGRAEPLRFVDKMLTNYYNVGFIHMLFPNALILHVAREPMDTIFSAYKHEFPPGPLDYTSHFPSLAEYYHGYRDLMEHWDRELPGRVTHVRYEDLVHDMPGVARKIIDATGLEWDPSVLDFHTKKQAVNTLSTTQVRKGIYKDSLQAWRRYETHLQPLVELIGDRTTYSLKTSLPGYEPPTEGTSTEQDAAQSGDGAASEL